jgi:single-strand DNA-binding protein
MANLNRVTIIGRLGKDPEERKAGESSVCNFSVAVSEKFKGRDGEMQERTEWVNCVAWSKLAEICSQYLRKGSLVYCEGKLQTRKWEADGQTRYATEVRLDGMQMLDAKGGNGGRESSHTEPVVDRDLQF